MYNQVKKSLIFRKFSPIVLIKQLTLCFIFALAAVLVQSTQHVEAGKFDFFVLEASGNVKSYQVSGGSPYLKDHSVIGDYTSISNHGALALVRDMQYPEYQTLCAISDTGLHVSIENKNWKTYSGYPDYPVDPVGLAVGLEVVSPTPVIVTDKVNFVVTGTRFIDYRTSPEKKTEYWNEKYVRNGDEITSPTIHHSFRPPLPDLKSQKYQNSQLFHQLL